MKLILPSFIIVMEGRNMRRKGIFVIFTFLMLCLLISGVFYFKKMSVYALKFEGFRQYDTDNFSILYKSESEKDLMVVAQAAEKAYKIVGEDFDFYPKERVTIIIYPDSQSLQEAFGWPSDESTQGVYYRGTIYVQAPGAWIKDRSDIYNSFFEKGPMIHEYTHLVVDELTGGNHSRWFTEGVAQYEEERVTGYTLRQDFDVKEGEYYSIEEIFYSFDNLADVAKAYITALDMTKALAGSEGIRSLKEIMAELKDGASSNDIFLERAADKFFEGKSFLAKNI